MALVNNKHPNVLQRAYKTAIVRLVQEVEPPALTTFATSKVPTVVHRSVTVIRSVVCVQEVEPLAKAVYVPHRPAPLRVSQTLTVRPAPTVETNVAAAPANSRSNSAPASAQEPQNVAIAPTVTPLVWEVAAPRPPAHAPPPVQAAPNALVVPTTEPFV